MATTASGAALTASYRAEQLAIQAGSIEGLLQLWRVVDPSRLAETIDVFAQAASLLGAQGFQQSATSAAQYYAMFRAAEIGAGLLVPPAPRPLAAYIEGQLRGAALSGIIKARRAGKSVPAAKGNGLVKVIGTLGRLVLSGGRTTITAAASADKQALGWMRATSGDPCPFCRLLASRGATYKSEQTADFQPHDHCGCTPEPLYADTDTHLGPAATGREFLAEFLRAKAWARTSGTMSTGTSNNALNDYRRWLAAGKPTAGNAGTENSGK